ncbi:TPA: hypothetical protein ACH3X2_000267 [Trebouxia sp. C0005]
MKGRFRSANDAMKSLLCQLRSFSLGTQLQSFAWENMLRAMQWHEEKAQGPEPTDGHASKQSVVRQGSGWPDGDASRRDLHSLREAPLQPGGDPSQSGPPQPVFFWGPDWGTMLLVVSMLTEGATAVGLGTTISKPSGWFFTGVLSTSESKRRVKKALSAQSCPHRHANALEQEQSSRRYQLAE